MISFKPAIAGLVLASCAVSQCSAAAGGNVRSRKLSFSSIAGYEPLNIVTDHNALDLDVAEMEKLLRNGEWSAAHHVYMDGGFGEVYADLTLTKALTEKVPTDTKVSGMAEDGSTAIGRTLREAEAGEKALKVQYKVSPIQDSYVSCQVGALWRVSSANLDGCFRNHNGTVTIAGVGDYGYTYDIRQNNKAGRTLKILSTSAEQDMVRCAGCPYETFEKYNNYYGKPKYANEFVTAAFHGESTNFTLGNVDFTDISNASRAESITKGAVNLNIYMAVIRKLEDAVSECENGSNRPKTLSWDEAVAFYTGSREGTDGKDTGKLLHELADTRCANFHTCGADAHKASGHAKVNHEIFQHFKLGQRNLLEGNCEQARINKNFIESRMIIPMIQGTLRYAHINGNEATKNEKAAAEGSAFAAAVLPHVHACNPAAAAKIHENMNFGASTSFPEVKRALEETYGCMQISCEDVGGYYDKAANEYFEGAAPCTGTGSSGGGANALGIAVGVTLIAVCVVAGAVFVARKRRMATEKAPPKRNPIFVTPEEPFT